MDKYEKFKNWFKKQDKYGTKNNYGIVPSEEVFKAFEEELEEKENREKTIKKIGEIVWENTSTVPYASLRVDAKRIYIKLKEEELLK